MDYRKEALDEYYRCQSRIADFDSRILNVKSWGTTTAAAMLGLSFSQEEPLLLVLSSIFALIFWYIEAQWKSFQMITIQHSIRLETIIEDADYLKYGYRGPSIGRTYETAFTLKNKVQRFFTAATYVNVWLPHAPLAIAGLGLYLSIEMGYLS